MSEDAFTPAMRAGLDDLARGVATAQLCRTSVVARGLIRKSLAEGPAEQALGAEQREAVTAALDALDRLIERLGGSARPPGLSPFPSPRSPAS
jgi:hypothetical protein